MEMLSAPSRLLRRLLRGLSSRRVRTPAEVNDLSIDLSRFRVCGLGAGASQADVERALGPPRDVFARRGVLEYPALGLTFTFIGRGSEEGVKEVVVHVARGDLDVERTLDAAPFAGRWLPWWSTRPPDEAGLAAVLGAPFHRQVDDDEVASLWEAGAHFVEAGFSPAGDLRWICLTLA